jgi:endonuclease/exonuclease/phosphatase (EEP) superfamily protein YafD
MISSRAIFGLSVGIFAAALLAWAGWGLYRAGYSAGRAAADATLMAARNQAQRERNEALATVITLNAEMLAVQADAGKRIAKAERDAAARVVTIERVVRENPDFSAVVRPGDAARVRDDQHRELADAAARSAELSARSLHGVRAPGAGE